MLDVLKTLLSRWNITPSKAYGQNFLLHDSLLTLIAEEVMSSQKVIEIGPGPGLLTKKLVKEGRKLVIVEKDHRFEGLLNCEIPSAIRLMEDVFTINWLDYEGFMWVGNLPYHLSVPILIKYLSYGSFFSKAIFMFQKEVGQRILALPGTKEYGRLSVMAQAFSSVQWLADITSSSFWPRPSIDSMLLSFTPLSNTGCSFQSLERIVEKAFFHRRKMLHHNLSLSPEQWQVWGISPKERAEKVTVKDFLALGLLLEGGNHVVTP